MNVVSFDYDNTYDPAAPIVGIEIDGYNDSLGKRTLWAMIDSGADATMIPLRTLEAIGATYTDAPFDRLRRLNDYHKILLYSSTIFNI